MLPLKAGEICAEFLSSRKPEAVFGVGRGGQRRPQVQGTEFVRTFEIIPKIPKNALRALKAG